MEKNYKYVRNNINDEYKIKTLQDKIMEIIVYFDEFCQKYNIKYFLMGGSALGAARHQGFIPWDDDMDIFMDYYNYSKFLKNVDKIDIDRFYFQRQDSYEQPYFFSKLRMNGTTFIDEYKNPDKKIHQGIFIDIMCLYDMPNSKILQKIQYYNAALLKAKAVLEYGYKTSSIKKKLQLSLANIIVNKCTKEFIYKQVYKYSINKAKDKYKYVGHLFGRAKFKNSVYLKEWFANQKYVDFEKIKLPVCSGNNDYLITRYGDKYMEMPSEETKKIYQSHAYYWSVNTDYKEYDKNEKI